MTRSGTWLLLLCALVGWPALASAEGGVRRARALAERGTRLFEAGRYVAAIEAFEQAYAIKPHFMVQCNIARCHELAGNLDAAAEHYRRCLSEGAEGTPMEAEVEQALGEVERERRTKAPRVDEPRRPGRDRREGQTRARPKDAREEAERAEAPAAARPYSLAVGLGPAVKLRLVASQLKVMTAFAYHLSGRLEGPAIGFAAQVGFQSDYISAEVGPTFRWDFLVVPAIGLYLAPTAMLGYAHTSERCYSSAQTCDASRNGVTIQVGAEAKLLLAERVAVFLRPLGLDLLPTANGGLGFAMRYDLMMGVGAVF